MNWKVLERSGNSLFEVLPRNLPGRAEETTEALRISSVSAEIQTQYLPNTSFFALLLK
jgi:hypothetical protein